MDHPTDDPLVRYLPAVQGRLMTAGEVSALLAHQRAVSGHVAALHACPHKPGRRAILARISDDAVRAEVERVFMAQWRRLKESA